MEVGGDMCTTVHQALKITLISVLVGVKQGILKQYNKAVCWKSPQIQYLSYQSLLY